MMGAFEIMYGCKPREYTSPLEKGDHPEIPKDLPKPLGKSVTTIAYKDANLYHDMVTGRSMSGILNFCNQTLIDIQSHKPRLSQ
jgi:hypothetical protein